MKLDFSKIPSLGEALRDATSRYGTNIAFFEADRERENGRWTYTDVRREAERVASVLQERGLAPGDRCAILMTNQAKWPISATGVFWAGLALVPLDYKLSPPEQLALLAHARPKALIVEWPIWSKLRAHAQVETVLVTEAPDKEDVSPSIRWEAGSRTGFSYRPRDRSDVACIVYSSGTGGRAKGCMLLHHNYLSQASSLAALYPMAENERYFSILPTNHAIDFMCGYFLPLTFGAAVVHQRTLRPEFLAFTMKRYGVTHMALVPMLLKAFEKKIRENIAAVSKGKRFLLKNLIALNAFATRRTPRHGLSRLLLKPIHDPFGGRLRFLFAGGAFVDPAMAEFFYRLGLPVAIGYGLTEACTVLTVNDLKPFRSDTVGTPVEGVRIEIRNRNDQGVGEVWVRGPTVMKEYLDDPELTAETIIDGWLRTGDLGVLDDTDHLKLVGRAKDMIVTEGGKNVYPEDVETHFDDLMESHEHCVFASNYIWPVEGLQGNRLMLVVRPPARPFPWRRP